MPHKKPIPPSRETMLRYFPGVVVRVHCRLADREAWTIGIDSATNLCNRG